MKYLLIATEEEKQDLINSFDTSFLDYRYMATVKLPLVVAYDGEYISEVETITVSDLKDIIYEDD